MLQVIRNNVLYPLAGRLGTATSTFLVSYGVATDHADWVRLGVMGLAGVAFDLGVSFLYRRKFITDAFAAGWDTARGVVFGGSNEPK